MKNLIVKLLIVGLLTGTFMIGSVYAVSADHNEIETNEMVNKNIVDNPYTEQAEDSDAAVVNLAKNDEIAVISTTDETIEESYTEIDSFTAYTIEDVNLRESPSTESNVIKTLKTSMEIEVDGEINNWYHVYANEEDGYIYKNFVSTEKPEEYTNVGDIPNENASNLIEVTDNDSEKSEEEPVIETQEPNQEENQEQNSLSEAGNIIPGDAYQQDVLNKINEYRVANGRGTLQLTDKLCESAMVRASEARYTKEHNRLNGDSWVTSLTFSPQKASAELLGCSVSNHIVDLWKASPSHNEGMLLSEMTLCGIGYCYENGATYVALHLY